MRFSIFTYSAHNDMCYWFSKRSFKELALNLMFAIRMIFCMKCFNHLIFVKLRTTGNWTLEVHVDNRVQGTVILSIVQEYYLYFRKNLQAVDRFTLQRICSNYLVVLIYALEVGIDVVGHFGQTSWSSQRLLLGPDQFILAMTYCKLSF